MSSSAAPQTTTFYDGGLQDTSQTGYQDPPSTELLSDQPQPSLFSLLLAGFVPYYNPFARTSSRPKSSRMRKTSLGKTLSGLGSTGKNLKVQMISEILSSGPVIGTFHGKTVHSLNSQHRESWSRLQPQIESLISTMPLEATGASKFGSSPLVALRSGTMDAVPTVILSCSSPRYASLLRREIEDSGVLDMGDVVFEIETGTGLVTVPRPGDGEQVESYVTEVTEASGGLAVGDPVFLR
ncbi:hypothetical protein B0H66DRAFT_531096 [Apodospora peruviana]|uniref:Uncharacterized protein n=1 Tax=Apodospora peruviana TaxID=516989 RepID=A0AAE0IB22_9PEZI|nr:hypothetical protein B0H66DRAFT_531096 [Apodospora peruviana]